MKGNPGGDVADMVRLYVWVALTPYGRLNRETLFALLADKTMTVAAIDRIVHHAAIFEMNLESFRRRSAMDRAAKTPASQNNQTATG